MADHDIECIVNIIGRDRLREILGVGPSSMSNYIKKGSLPKKYQPVVTRELVRQGYKVDPHTLDIQGAGSGDPDVARKVLLIVGGGIAAYKALGLVRRLAEHGIRTTGVMTSSACEFVTPLSLAALTENKVYTSMFSLTDEAEMGHIRLARDADLVLVAPATANLMARAATGMADDLATAILLATAAPVMMAPSMNPAMWSNPATRHNLEILRARGVGIIGPESGDTACGEHGTGRMSEPGDIARAVVEAMPGAGGALAGLHALVTSGPTHEAIDDVRYIANRSSGKQGHAIADALARRGARVTLVSGPVALAPPAGVDHLPVTSARQMHDACLGALPADIAVCTAAVADWHIDGGTSGKLKKSAGTKPPVIKLRENPDILRALSASGKKRPRLVVGFAAEATDVVASARRKLKSKGCDWMIANGIMSGDGTSVFGSDTNSVTLLSDKDSQTWDNLPKREIATRLAARMEAHFT